MLDNDRTLPTQGVEVQAIRWFATSWPWASGTRRRSGATWTRTLASRAHGRLPRPGEGRRADAWFVRS